MHDAMHLEYRRRNLHERRSGAVMRCLDTGPGLPADAQAGAFDRFSRGGATREQASAVVLVLACRL